MIVKRLKIEELNIPKDQEILGKQVDICLCESCNSFFVYGTKNSSGHVVSSSRLCPYCLTQQLFGTSDKISKMEYFGKDRSK